MSSTNDRSRARGAAPSSLTRFSAQSRALVVFDGDDTLWRTQELYDAVKSAFADLVADADSVRHVLALLSRIDQEAVALRGFTVERFVNSMLETYRSLARQRGHEATQMVEQKIRALAEPLLGHYELYPDAIQALRQLSERFELVLATKGERGLQEQKVRQLGIDRYFSSLYFIERKTSDEYRHIIQTHGVKAEMAWAIGNSVRSDVNPATEIGMRAIWIRRAASWAYEEAHLEDEAVAIVDSLREAAEILLALTPSRTRLTGSPR